MKGHYVTINWFTWDKDSHGLYDYDSHPKKETINGHKSFVIARKRNGIFATSSSSNGTPLLCIVYINKDSKQMNQKQSKYYLDNCFQKQNQTWFDDLRNSNWIPVRYWTKDVLPHKNGYKLELGDVIKFGRIIFQVK